MVHFRQNYLYKFSTVAAVSLPRLHQRGRDTAATKGGGDKTASTRCRKGFRQFLEKAGLTGKMPRIVASGSRNDAYRSFCIALEQNGDELPLLLVDGEARVAPNSEPWHYLHQQDHWPKPQEATNEQVHLTS